MNKAMWLYQQLVLHQTCISCYTCTWLTGGSYTLPDAICELPHCRSFIIFDARPSPITVVNLLPVASYVLQRKPPYSQSGVSYTHGSGRMCGLLSAAVIYKPGHTPLPWFVVGLLSCTTNPQHLDTQPFTTCHWITWLITWLPLPADFM